MSKRKKWDADDWALILFSSIIPIGAVGLFVALVADVIVKAGC